MSRLHNFSAGPAGMPTKVLERAKEELLHWNSTGTSVMEVSHRGADYVALAHKAESNLRQLMRIDDAYAVLFLQGGASLQFAGVPMNLLQGTADYLETGAWSKKAYQEASRYTMLGQINLVASGKEGNYTDVPQRNAWRLTDKADYFHYCSNETIHGIYTDVPSSINAPLVCDMSSDILSRPVDVSRFGIIYAGAQKNIGPAGLSVVIIKKELLDKASSICPSVMNYSLQAKADSMLNTPATYAWYLAGLVFEWLLEKGGVPAIYEQNQAKAKLLYETIDGSSFYHNAINPTCRSIMNIPFTLADNSLDEVFLKQAKTAGLLALKGHRSVGGMRASIYNALELESVQVLVDFMMDFEKKFG